MNVRLQFSGPARYRTKSAALLFRAAVEVWLRRLRNGPRCALWNFAAEISTEIAQRQLLTAFRMRDVKEARSYLDAVAVHSSALRQVGIRNVVQGNFKGNWVTPKDQDSGVTILYLHGGGYAFYPRGFYNNLAAMIAFSARAKLFAVDYRLSPEHKFPSQIEDAISAYRWLLSEGVDPRRLVVAGDSAGGNLTLALLLSLRDSKLPLPTLAICLSPATDFETNGAGAPGSSEYDWITQEMAMTWADWFCTPEQRSNPLVSPVNADLRGLPPMYIQAGGAEILLPSIQLFVQRAKAQGADVVLETWPAMNHDFQAFGEDVPQSAEAIRRIGEVVASRILPRERTANCNVTST
jgi:acetyl esterase/lipase